MGESQFDSDVPFMDSGHMAAAVVCRTDHGNLHAGLLHRRAGQHPGVLHLGWQDHLSEEWSWAKLWAVPETEPEKLRVAAGVCRRIMRVYKKRRAFPYALAWLGSDFNSRGGLRLKPGSKGLTCATFILAVFKTAGVELVLEEDWPIRTADDRRFLELVAGFATDEHLEVLRSEVEAGCRRIQPHEVVGACACTPLPAAFEPTKSAAEEVLRMLEDGPTGHDADSSET
jgi:hypothetical protein